jgi:hypothetical protein
MIVVAVLCAFALIAGAVVIQNSLQKARRVALKRLTLKPNCLLTRHPIAFLSGEKSLFHLHDHWNAIPGFLKEHGYDVMVIEPPSRGDRPKAVIKALDAHDGKLHLIADLSQEPDLREIARAGSGKIATLTLIKNPSRPEEAQALGKRPSAEDLKPIDSSILTFETAPAPEYLKPPDFASRCSSLLLWAHNLTRPKRHATKRRQVDPWETGVVQTTPPWFVESRFLDLAISLAERDAQWCD